MSAVSASEIAETVEGGGRGAERSVHDGLERVKKEEVRSSDGSPRAAPASLGESGDATNTASPRPDATDAQSSGSDGMGSLPEDTDGSQNAPTLQCSPTAPFAEPQDIAARGAETRPMSAGEHAPRSQDRVRIRSSGETFASLAEALLRAEEDDEVLLQARARARAPPPPRTKWTRRVPHPVLIGHAVSLTPYQGGVHLESGLLLLRRAGVTILPARSSDGAPGDAVRSPPRPGTNRTHVCLPPLPVQIGRTYPPAAQPARASPRPP